MALCSVGCLKAYCVLLGTALLLLSVAGIGLGLFMLFGEPWYERTGGTYRPNWENIGPCFIASLVSLVMNLALAGGAVQRSRRILTAWLVWHGLLVLIFWLWYAYSLLKHHGYIDWRQWGMRECYWCTLRGSEHTGFAAALATLFLLLAMVPVQLFRGQLNKHPRGELSRSQYEMAAIPYSSNDFNRDIPYSQNIPYGQNDGQAGSYTQPHYGQDPYSQDPYSQNPYSQNLSYSQNIPYNQDNGQAIPYNQGSYSQDAYNQGPYRQDPYSQGSAYIPGHYQ